VNGLLLVQHDDGGHRIVDDKAEIDLQVLLLDPVVGAKLGKLVLTQRVDIQIVLSLPLLPRR